MPGGRLSGRRESRRVIPLILGLVSQVGAAVAVARGFRVLVEGRSSSGKASQTPMATGFLEPAEACVEYAYNQLGQRILDDRTMPNGNQLAHFTYNQRLELVKSKRQRACQPPEIHTYAYDLNHNRTAKDGVGYTNNLADQLLTAGTAHLSYNGAGQATDVANWDLTYNCSDQITGIQAPGKNIAYRYDAGGQRVSKSVNGVASHYLWDGGDIRKEYNADGSVKAEYFLGAGREGIKSGGQWYYYLSDIQGSTLMLTDAHGNPAATYDYSDYGETIQTSGSTTLYNPFLYTGQEYDAETGLYHLRARHYSPGKGRFFARDPIGYAGGSNMYAYCAGDPINFTDPSGLQEIYTLFGRGVSLSQGTLYINYDVRYTSPNPSRDYTGSGARIRANVEVPIEGNWQPQTSFARDTGSMTFQEVRSFSFRFENFWSSDGKPKYLAAKISISLEGGERFGAEELEYTVELMDNFCAIVVPNTRSIRDIWNDVWARERRNQRRN